MTLLPTESWNVKARPDLPAYELNTVDPINGEAAAENHHLWRRSFGKDFREAWWVELDDGTIVPNRIALCNEVHRAVTDNEIHIIYSSDVDAFLWYWTGDPVDLAEPLAVQPGPAGALGRTPVGNPETQGAMQTTIEGEEVPHEHVVDEQGVEVPCDKCKGLGKYVKRPKRERETAPARAKTTWSVRVPKDDRENGYAVIDALVDGCVEKLHDAGLIRDKNRGANYYALVYALRYFVAEVNVVEEVSE